MFIYAAGSAQKKNLKALLAVTGLKALAILFKSISFQHPFHIPSFSIFAHLLQIVIMFLFPDPNSIQILSCCC